MQKGVLTSQIGVLTYEIKNSKIWCMKIRKIGENLLTKKLIFNIFLSIDK